MAERWSEQLKEKHVREFSFFPNAYTPMEEDKSIPLPAVEVEYGGDSAEESEEESTTPEWVKNVSFTIAGITIGGAAVYGLFATTPPPACPAPITTTQPQVPSSLPSSTSSHPSTATTTSSAGGAPRATTTPATSATSSSTTQQNGSSVSGTL